MTGAMTDIAIGPVVSGKSAVTTRREMNGITTANASSGEAGGESRTPPAHQLCLVAFTGGLVSAQPVSRQQLQALHAPDKYYVPDRHLVVGAVIAVKAVKRAAGVRVTRRIVMPSGFHTT